MIALLGGVALTPACRPDTLELAYHFDPHAVLTYRMVAEARASWDIGGPGEGSYEVEFEVQERVEQLSEGGAVVEVSMIPVEVHERGLPAPGSDSRSFTLELEPTGEVAGVRDVDGVRAQTLDPDELALIGTYRPPLPPGAVRLHDTWRSERSLRLASVFQQIVTLGSLDELGVDARGRLASLAYHGDGPLVWTSSLPQGDAQLTGDATTSIDALLDIDGGFLRSARSSTSGDFEVRVSPEGGQAPITGRLQLDLDLSLQLVERESP